MRVNSLFRVFLSHGVTGNTPDFDSGKSRFEPWWDNLEDESRESGILSYQLTLIAHPIAEAGDQLTDNRKRTYGS
jgi:hypothetical protein